MTKRILCVAAIVIACLALTGCDKEQDADTTALQKELDGLQQQIDSAKARKAKALARPIAMPMAAVPTMVPATAAAIAPRPITRPPATAAVVAEVAPEPATATATANVTVEDDPEEAERVVSDHPIYRSVSHPVYYGGNSGGGSSYSGRSGGYWYQYPRDYGYSRYHYGGNTWYSGGQCYGYGYRTVTRTVTPKAHPHQPDHGCHPDHPTRPGNPGHPTHPDCPPGGYHPGTTHPVAPHPTNPTGGNHRR